MNQFSSRLSMHHVPYLFVSCTCDVISDLWTLLDLHVYNLSLV